MTKQRIARIRQKIKNARVRLMKHHSYFALLLMYLKMVAVPGMDRISTNGRCIFFDPDYLEKMRPSELDYLLCHQILHLTLGHIWQDHESAEEDHHFACNIIINSILEESGLLPARPGHLGYIYSKIPGTKSPGRDLTPEQILSQTLLRISMLDKHIRNQYMEDSAQYWDHEEDTDNSGILILDINEKDPFAKPAAKNGEGINGHAGIGGSGEKLLQTLWEQYSQTAVQCSLCKQQDRPQNGSGKGSNSYLRHLNKVKGKGKIDWRMALNEFIQEEVMDYSFSPPDRRYNDSEFFMPDFNEKDTCIKDILFMVDTSGSIKDDDLLRIYKEIINACEQFNGKLQGKLGFFDDHVYPPIPFETAEDILSVSPFGGGGTDFSAIFSYVQSAYNREALSCIIVFTDGHGFYPNESEASCIPILWIIYDNPLDPPFGKVIHLEKEHTQKNQLTSR